MTEDSRSTSYPGPVPGPAAVGETDLVVREVGDEVIVYHRQTQRAYCLNRSLAEVWRAASENEHPERIVQRLRECEIPQASSETVAYAVNLLRSNDLLQRENFTAQFALPATSRRDCLRALGAGAAAALPALSAVNVPEAFAQASECGQQNDPCGPGFPPCCPGKRCQQTGSGPKCVG